MHIFKNKFYPPNWWEKTEDACLINQQPYDNRNNSNKDMIFRPISYLESGQVSILSVIYNYCCGRAALPVLLTFHSFKDLQAQWPTWPILHCREKYTSQNAPLDFEIHEYSQTKKKKYLRKPSLEKISVTERRKNTKTKHHDFWWTKKYTFYFSFISYLHKQSLLSIAFTNNFCTPVY